MITLSREEAEIVHEFLCDLRLKYEWEQKNLSYDKSIAKEVEELSDCIGRMEAKLEFAAAGTEPPRDGAPVPVTAIKTGDTVRHRPSGETWTVKQVKGDRLYPYGWPTSCALLSDCELVETK